MIEGLPDFAEKTVPHHFVTKLYRRRETFRIGPAVALDDDAVEPEEHAAVRLARIHFVAQRGERIARQHITEPRAQRSLHGVSQIGAELAGGPFRRLDGDVAGKPFGDDHVRYTRADAGALDEPDIVEARQLSFPQNAPGLAQGLQSFDFFDSNVENPDRGLIDIEQHAGHRAAHYRKIDQMLGVGADRGAHVEDDRFPGHRRPYRRYRPAADA